MHNFCAVDILAVLFCLVVCVSANTEVSKTDATAAVDAAKEAVTAVRVKAQTQLNNAQRLSDKVESAKNKAKAATSKSQEKATDNAKTLAIAQQIKSLSDGVASSYVDAKGKIGIVVKSLTPLLESAKQLESTSTIAITANEGKEDDFTDTKSRATALQGKAVELDGQITAAIELVTEVSAKADEMERKTKQAQLKDAHVSAIVGVAKIESIFGKAENSIPQIEEKRNEVSGIVDEMQTLKINAPTVSNKNIEALHQSAANALRDLTDALDSAKISRTAITKQKGVANAVLTKVQPETGEVSEAQKEVKNAEACVRAAQQSFFQIEAALQTATNSVTSAKDLKKKLKTALSTTTTEQNTQQTKEKQETNLPVADGTDSHQKDTTIQPTSKDSPNPSDNTSEKIKKTLIQSAQNVPPTALTGGKAPAAGAKNDSAMTVSVPLLVALIAYAVLK